MGRIFGWVLLLAALYVGMTVYTEGIEHAFGGAFAPLEPIAQREEPSATALTPAAQMADAPSERRHATAEGEGRPERARRVPITEAVRERVTSDLQTGARRRGY